MKLSICLRGKICYAATSSENALVHESENLRSVSDDIVPFIRDVIDGKEGEISELIVSAGPGSFTSIRVLNSIARGILITKPSISVVSVSNFLPYLMILRQHKKDDGIIAIPTMRGDFFCMDFLDDSIYNYRVCDEDVLQDTYQNVYFDDSEIFNSHNFAGVQLEILGSNIANINKNLIHNNLDVVYGFDPEYKY